MTKEKEISKHSSRVALSPLRAISGLLLIFALLVLVYQQYLAPPKRPLGHESGFSQPPLPLFDQGEASLFKERRLSDQVTKEVHAATLAQSADGALHAFWYGGTREGAKDVAIYGAQFDHRREVWSSSRVVVTREETQQALHRYIKKVGNPVVALHEGQLALFYVSVSVGGWAGSAINVKWSSDGITWGRPYRLITSPFLNISTLVKSNAIHFQQGHLGLPVYHEFIRKFGELIELDADNRVVDKQRLSWGDESLQPVVLLQDDQHAQTYLRYGGEDPQMMLLSETDNAGRSWGHPVKTTLPNPNAAIAGHRIRSGPLANAIIMVFNNAVHARNRLSLAISQDEGRSWQVFHDVEYDPDQEARFAYPYLYQSTTGRYHLLYTYKRLYIKHVEFNDAWLIDKVALKDVGARGGSDE